jgi:predicted enzyme related to lactoylglutathione lyase
MDPSRLHHFCLAVNDLDDATAQIEATGVALIGGPMDIEDIGQRIAFITDNLGTIIELTSPGTWPGGHRS